MHVNDASCEAGDSGDRAHTANVQPGIIESSENPPWRLSDERAFHENLLCSRFNFFLVFFSLVVAGAITTDEPQYSKTLLVLGTLISLPLCGTLVRAQAKLDILLKVIFNEKNHPARFTDLVCGANRWRKRGWYGAPWNIVVAFTPCPSDSKRRWIGYWIPLMCVSALALGTVLALCEQLPGSQPKDTATCRCVCPACQGGADAKVR